MIPYCRKGPRPRMCWMIRSEESRKTSPRGIRTLLGKSAGADFPSSRRGSRQIADSDQVVGRHREGEHPADPVYPFVPGLAHQAHRLEPAEDLLDPLARPLAHGVARVAGGASISGAGT